MSKKTVKNQVESAANNNEVNNRIINLLEEIIELIRSQNKNEQVDTNKKLNNKNKLLAERLEVIVGNTLSKGKNTYCSLVCVACLLEALKKEIKEGVTIKVSEIRDLDKEETKEEKPKQEEVKAKGKTVKGKAVKGKAVKEEEEEKEEEVPVNKEEVPVNKLKAIQTNIDKRFVNDRDKIKDKTGTVANRNKKMTVDTFINHLDVLSSDNDDGKSNLVIRKPGEYMITDLFVFANENILSTVKEKEERRKIKKINKKIEEEKPKPKVIRKLNR